MPKPFLKFPGGKRGIIGELTSRLPKDWDHYFEPFIGGGALFFELAPLKATISDINAELINTYKVVRDKPVELENVLRKMPYHPEDMVKNKAFYEKLRALDRDPEKWAAFPDVKKAARMIYLNKTCFNGLYRVNSKGHFNSPMGDYKNPKIVDSVTLGDCSLALQGRVIMNCSYDKIIWKVGEGDFVYLDPPYLPITKTANFTSYSADGFNYEDHQKLAEHCRKIDERGGKFMLSNSNSDIAKELYQGFNIEVIAAPRAINRDATGRKGTDILVRNYS